MAGAKGKYAEKAVEVLRYISEGHSNKDAAKKAGISEALLYEWLNTKVEFLESFKEAKKQGDKVRINSVESSLLDVARGFEYEEVRTEYESKLNPSTGQYEPTIKKQVRTKKRVVPQTEAIKFYLTNKAPEEWKNRVEQNTTGNLATDLQIKMVSVNPTEEEFPSSEADVKV